MSHDKIGHVKDETNQESFDAYHQASTKVQIAFLICATVVLVNGIWALAFLWMIEMMGAE